MQNIIKRSLSIVLLSGLILCGNTAVKANETGNNQTVIYPAVATADKSQEFSVRVNGEPIFVEQHIPATPGDHYNLAGITGDITYHYAQFAFEGTVEIVIEASSGFQDYTLSPRRFDIEADIRRKTMTFKLEEPRHLVLRIGSHWLYILPDPVDHNAPKIGDAGVVNITDYEVDSTGKTLNTFQIQKAIIDVATGPDAGGVLYFPPGVYKTGTLKMYSHVTLYLAPGAVLQASSDPRDFPLPFGPNHKSEDGDDIPVGPPGRDYGYDYALLRIHHATNVAVKGAGILDAAGVSNGRLKIIHVQDSENIRFQDITLRHGHGWMFPILYSERVRVNNVKVISPLTSNTDGIDPDSSTDVVIDGAFVVSGDDAIVLKSTNFGNRLRKVMRDVTVKNSTLLTVKSALKIGTETRSERYTNIVFDNNSVVTADRAFVIYLRDGALVENVSFSNNTVEGAGGISDDNNRIFDIVISQRNRDVIWQHPDWSEEMRNNPGQIRNLLFENITIDTDGTLFLSDSRIQGFNAANNIDGLTFRGITLNGEPVKNPEMTVTYGNGKSSQLLKIDYTTVRNVWFNGKRLDAEQ